MTGLVYVARCFLSLGQCSSFTSHSLITYHSVGIEITGSGVPISRQKCKGLLTYISLFSFLETSPCFSLCQSIFQPQEKTNSWCVCLRLLPGFSVPVAHHVGAVFGLGGLYVLRHRQVDELVLGLCLHHARALLSHHLDVLGDVNITVQTYRGEM